MAEFARLFAAGRFGASSEGTSAGHERPPATPDTRDIFQFLAQAWLAYVASGLRYWSQLADAWARTVPAVARVLTDGDAAAKRPDGRAVAIDDLRSRLRELADIPSQESRVLQAELDRIASGLWPKTDAKPDGPYWRRWETKP
jgi:hypothetical protein